MNEIKKNTSIVGTSIPGSSFFPSQPLISIPSQRLASQWARLQSAPSSVVEQATNNASPPNQERTFMRPEATPCSVLPLLLSACINPLLSGPSTFIKRTGAIDSDLSRPLGRLMRDKTAGHLHFSSGVSRKEKSPSIRNLSYEMQASVASQPPTPSVANPEPRRMRYLLACQRVATLAETLTKLQVHHRTKALSRC